MTKHDGQDPASPDGKTPNISLTQRILARRPPAP